MNYLIFENDGLYDVTCSGVVVDTFVSYEEAQEHILVLKWERDMAFSDIGCEFDGSVDGEVSGH